MVKKGDLFKLAEVSDIAKLFTDNEKCELVEIFNMAVLHEPVFSFHLNGKYGSIKLNDECLFGFRGDYLMWAEGECEGVEDSYAKTNGNTIILYGDYKGSFCVYMLHYNF